MKNIQVSVGTYLSCKKKKFLNESHTSLSGIYTFHVENRKCKETL